MKSIINLIIIALLLILLSYFNVIDIKIIFSLDVKKHYIPILLSIFLLFIGNTLSGLRWKSLCKAYNYELSNYQCLKITYKAGLLSYILPGQIGSEITKVYLATRGESTKSRDAILSATIWDRVFALFSQLVLLVILSYNAFYKLNNSLFYITSISIIFSIVIITFYIFLNFSFKKTFQLLGKHKFISYIGNFLKIVKDLLVTSPKYVFKILIYSVSIHMIGIYVIYLLANILYYSASFSELGFMTLVSNIFAVIPITPGGIGMSELVFSYLGNLLDLKYTLGIANIYILFRIFNIGSFIIGETIIIFTSVFIRD